MATFNVENIVEAGIEATYNNANGGGDDFSNDSSERTFLHVKNSGGSDETVTVSTAQSTLDLRGWGELSKSDVSVSVSANTGEEFIGPCPQQAFGSQPAISYSDATNITVAVRKGPSSA